MRYYLSVICLLSMVALTGCFGQPTREFGTIMLDGRFSYNVARVPDEWPDEEVDWDDNQDVAENQQRIYDTMGAPDFFYMLWRRDGRPMTSREFETSSWYYRDDEENNPYNERPDMGWVYLADEVMYTFNRREAVANPLTDSVETIGDYGDPHEIKESTDSDGKKIEIYQYYDIGKVFYFREGELYDEQDLPRMEGYMKRR